MKSSRASGHGAGDKRALRARVRALRARGSLRARDESRDEPEPRAPPDPRRDMMGRSVGATNRDRWEAEA